MQPLGKKRPMTGSWHLFHAEEHEAFNFMAKRLYERVTVEVLQTALGVRCRELRAERGSFTLADVCRFVDLVLPLADFVGW